MDSDGNLYFTGEFDGIPTFDAIPLTRTSVLKSFIAEYDPNGQALWAREGGGAGIVVDSLGNIFARGSFFGTASFGSFQLTSRGGEDMFVANYDPVGQLRWVRQSGGLADDDTEGIALDQSGNCYVTGRIRGDAQFGAGTLTNTNAMTVFVVTYSPEGRVSWAQAVGTCTQDISSSIVVDGAGNCYTASSFTGSASFGVTNLSNTAGSGVFLARSFAPCLTLQKTDQSLGLRIVGSPGSGIRVEFAPALNGPERQWQPWTNFFLPAPTHLLIQTLLAPPCAFTGPFKSLRASAVRPAQSRGKGAPEAVLDAGHKVFLPVATIVPMSPLGGPKEVFSNGSASQRGRSCAARSYGQ